MRATRPFWTDPQHRIYEELTDDQSVDVAIIGGGIAGVAAAHWVRRLAQSTCAIVEARSIASGASGRNAGFVMAVAPENFPCSEDPIDVERARRIWAFTARNKALIVATIEDLGLDVEFRSLGSLGLAASEAEWRWICDTSVQAIAAGLAVELIEAHEIPNAWLRSQYFGGAWYSDNGEMNPAKFVAGLASSLVGGGVRIYEGTPIMKLERERDTWVLSTRRGRLLAQRVIVATNAYTRELLPQLEAYISPTRGQMVATEQLDIEVASCPVYANNGFQYWRQSTDGRLLLGGWRDLDVATEVGTTERLNPSIQKALTEFAQGLCGFAPQIDFRWSGIMGFTPDRLPLVGLIPGFPGLALVAGFSGHGIAMAFHAAEHAVSIVLGHGSEYADLFDPTRFGNYE